MHDGLYLQNNHLPPSLPLRKITPFYSTCTLSPTSFCHFVPPLSNAVLAKVITDAHVANPRDHFSVLTLHQHRGESGYGLLLGRLDVWLLGSQFFFVLLSHCFLFFSKLGWNLLIIPASKSENGVGAQSSKYVYLIGDLNPCNVTYMQ